MKSTFRFLAIIVFAAVIGFSMVACSLFKGEEEEQETQTTNTQTPGGQIPGGEQPGGEQPGGEQPGADPTHTHQYGEWLVTTHATCVETGVETRTCALDSSHTETQIIPIDPNAHVLGSNSTITKPATCTEDGIASGICTLNPSHVLNNSPISALGHDYGNWTQTTAVTETIDGSETRTCTHDSLHKETRTAYATGTPGLAFEAIGNTAYRVRKGTVTTGAVHIPAYHRADANSPYLPVTQIGASGDGYNNGAFQSTSIISVTFAPNSQLTSINGDQAFAYCTSLTSITIPAGVTYLGSRWTFSDCTSLASITIPASVTSIGNYAFRNCTSLASITVDSGNATYSSEGGILFNKAKTALIVYPSANGAVTIPAGVTSIGNDAFYGCTSLTSVIIPSSVTSIGNDAFHGCTSLTSITIPSSVASIGFYAFYDCNNLTSISIPAGVTSIDGSTFGNCNNLTSISIPAGVTSIGTNAFNGCTSLTSVTIPNSVASIGTGAFGSCTSLTSVTFAGTIASGSFGTNPFPGDLRAKFYADNSANGTPGTYTATGTGISKVWTRQP